MKTMIKRVYLGKMDSPTERENRAFNAKHLRAYLKRAYRFRYGRNTDGSPKYFIVQQSYV